MKQMRWLVIKEAWYWYETKPYTHGLGIKRGMYSTCDINEDWYKDWYAIICMMSIPLLFDYDWSVVSAFFLEISW